MKADLNDNDETFDQESCSSSVAKIDVLPDILMCVVV